MFHIKVLFLSPSLSCFSLSGIHDGAECVILSVTSSLLSVWKSVRVREN